MKKILFVLLLFSYHEIISQTIGQGVNDADGNHYNTVIIGNQEWMSENLKSTKYCNGDVLPINNNNSTGTWGNLTVGAWNISPNYPNNGKFYNWYAAADNRNICPCNWHVPSDSEWTTLENYLIANGFNYDGSSSGNKIGKALASQNPTQNLNWISSSNIGAIGNNTLQNNSSGFNATPDGMLPHSTPINSDIGYFTNWWTATEYAADCAWVKTLYNSSINISKINYDYGIKSFGNSIRCVKNSPLSTENQLNSSFYIYPNPTKNSISINLPNQHVPSNYIIYDITGKNILIGTIDYENFLINVTELQSGIYFITILQETKSKTIKFIKL
jgi:uncharacterized protein (TIGR02145 family)